MITYKLNHTPEDGFEMTELVEMCNELELELCQLDDIIEDYLTDFTL